MDKRYRVSGIFILEVEAEDSRKASGKAERIMRNSGIDGYVIEAEEVEEARSGRSESNESITS